MCSEVWIDPQSLFYGFLNEIMNHSCLDGGPRRDRSNVPNLMKNVPNFMKDVPNFVKDIPRVPKCVQRWESDLSDFCRLLNQNKIYNIIHYSIVACTRSKSGFSTNYCSIVVFRYSPQGWIILGN